MERRDPPAELSTATGATEGYAHPSGLLRYSEGVKDLIEKTQASWLLDLIAFAQPRATVDVWLRDFQLWEVHVLRDRSLAVVCSRDSEEEAFRLERRPTECQLGYTRLYLRGGVLQLPSEQRTKGESS